MKEWIPYSQQEIFSIGANAKPLTDSSEVKCTACGKISVRFYYRENSNSSGTTWAWCHNCYKYVHSRGEAISKLYDYNDPIADVSEKAGSRWYEYLDSLWEEGRLPQTFILKTKK